MKISSIEQLQQMIGGYRLSRIIQTAVKLRIFDHTRSGQPVDVETITERAKLSIRGTDILLDALAAMGLLNKTGKKYENSALAEQYLVSHSDSMLMFSIDHAEQIYRRWAYLPESVQDGQAHSGDQPSIMADADANRVFIRAMHARGLDRGRQIAKSLDLKDIQKVADIGGGAGSYLIALAERKPDIDCSLLDVPLTLKVAEEIVTEHNPAMQFKYVESDIFEGNDSFGNNFDLVILSNIIHIVGPEQNIRLFKRAKAAMANGGMLLIQDFLLDETATQPPGAAYFAVNMLTGTETGRAWREVDVLAWLKEAGFSSVKRLDAGTDSDILIGLV